MPQHCSCQSSAAERRKWCLAPAGCLTPSLPRSWLLGRVPTFVLSGTPFCARPCINSSYQTSLSQCNFSKSGLLHCAALASGFYQCFAILQLNACMSLYAVLSLAVSGVNQVSLPVIPCPVHWLAAKRLSQPQARRYAFS